MSQKLRGFVAQSMSGKKKRFVAYTYAYSPGSYTWASPATGYYLFTNWGPGASGGGGNPGASGGFTQTLRLIPRGQTVAVVAGGAGNPSTFTFANGSVPTAGSAAANVPGTATGGDLNLAGSAGGSGSPTSDGLGNNGGTAGVGATGGGGAPGNGTYKGANGGSIGPGAGGSNGSGQGNGLAIITRQDSSIRT